MNEQNVVEFEPPRVRSDSHAKSERSSAKAELDQIAGSQLLVLASVIARNVLDGYEMRDRLRNRRTALMVAGALVVAIGIGQIVIQLIKS